MEISKVELMNFKPFYGKNELDLSINPEQNLVLIGGRNGQGKTSFLVGLVWCLYGKGISEVDKVFRKEIKGGNYEKFLLSSLNLKAREEGETTFKVSIEFKDVEISEALASDSSISSTIILTRSYNTSTYQEDFKILVDGRENQLISEDEQKPLFVDAFLIPKDAARFFFFDAEKISEISELSVKEQGRMMNDALGRILGLSRYESLIQDLQIYRDNLKTKNAKQSTLLRQIEALQNKINLNTNEIEQLENSLSDKEDEVNILDNQISEINRFLIQSGVRNINFDLGDLEKRKNLVDSDKVKLSERLHEISEYLPFAIVAGLMNELVEQLKAEEADQRRLSAKKEVQNQAEEYLEKLFNRPPFPDEDITLKQKLFYYSKAEDLFEEFQSNEPEGVLECHFKHDLGRISTEYVFDVYDTLGRYSHEVFQSVFNDFIRMKNELNDIQRELNRARAHSDDDNILELKDRLRAAQKERDLANQEYGSISNRLINLSTETKTLKKQHENLLDQIEVSKQDQDKLDYVSRYITALKEFVRNQKISKAKSLEGIILKEMHHIMHKKDFLDKVKVNLLPDGDGMEVILTKNDKEVPLPSSGEKQIFISCLLKAILSQAIVNLPVVIDTPLGRLDRQHKDNFVQAYYPYLANQVIILSTDEEITQRRKQEIDNCIARTYLIVNQGGQTKILNQYF